MSEVGLHPQAQALNPALPYSTVDSGTRYPTVHPPSSERGAARTSIQRILLLLSTVGGGENRDPAHVITTGTDQESDPGSVPTAPNNPARSSTTSAPITEDGITIQLRDGTTHAAICNDIQATVHPQSRQDTHATVNPDTRQGTQATVSPNARQGTHPPTLRTLLQRTTEIRRDHVEAPEKKKVELPKPLAADIEDIDALYEAGGDWSALAPRIDRARPYVLPRARYVMVIETGQAFQRTSPNKLLTSFSNDHGNQIMPGGNLRIKVKTKEACFRLERQEVTILGSKYRFREFDILADRFYIDVSSVDSDVDADLMLKRFSSLGTTDLWYVQRRESRRGDDDRYLACSVCDQLVFAGRIHPVHAKDAPFPAQRMSFGYRSRYALELQAPTTTTAAVANTRTTTQNVSHLHNNRERLLLLLLRDQGRRHCNSRFDRMPSSNRWHRQLDQRRTKHPVNSR
ncbi:hypothetical protein Plhal703r1_c57g0162781 [Plasmopara halstedii]